MYQSVRLSEVLDLLEVIVANAVVVPDPRMQGSTDCYAVPLDDIEAATIYLDQHRVK